MPKAKKVKKSTPDVSSDNSTVGISHDVYYAEEPNVDASGMDGDDFFKQYFEDFPIAKGFVEIVKYALSLLVEPYDPVASVLEYHPEFPARASQYLSEDADGLITVPSRNEFLTIVLEIYARGRLASLHEMERLLGKKGKVFPSDVHQLLEQIKVKTTHTVPTKYERVYIEVDKLINEGVKTKTEAIERVFEKYLGEEKGYKLENFRRSYMRYQKKRIQGTRKK